MSTLKNLTNIPGHLLIPEEFIKENGSSEALLYFYLVNRWVKENKPTNLLVKKLEIMEDLKITIHYTNSSISNLEQRGYLTTKKWRYGVTLFTLSQEKEI